jgi:hypothetical protein
VKDSQAAINAVRAWNREHHPCAVPGCKFVRHKGRLCREHWRLVPLAEIMEWTTKGMTVSHELARKGAERATRKVLAQLKADARQSRPARG